MFPNPSNHNSDFFPPYPTADFAAISLKINNVIDVKKAGSNVLLRAIICPPENHPEKREEDNVG